MNPTYGPPITQDEARLIEAMLQNLPPNITLGLSNYTPPRTRDECTIEQLMDEIANLHKELELHKECIRSWQCFYGSMAKLYSLPEIPMVKL